MGLRQYLKRCSATRDSLRAEMHFLKAASPETPNQPFPGRGKVPLYSVSSPKPIYILKAHPPGGGGGGCNELTFYWSKVTNNSLGSCFPILMKLMCGFWLFSFPETSAEVRGTNRECFSADQPNRTGRRGRVHLYGQEPAR